MVPDASESRISLPVAVLAGVCYAAVVLVWAFTTGVHFTTDDPVALVVGFGYASGGMFLLAAVPVYLLGRASLVSPSLVAAWSLANTAYQRWFLARPHDALASYLTVWPLVLGLVLLVALVEVGTRVGLDRGVGRFGLRTVF